MDLTLWTHQRQWCVTKAVRGVGRGDSVTQREESSHLIIDIIRLVCLERLGTFTSANQQKSKKYPIENRTSLQSK